MIRGRYGQGREALPRVIHISIARYHRDLPKPGEPLDFLVSIHEEGTGITWQQNVTVDSEAERFFLEATQDLYFWSLNLALTPDKARKRAQQMGLRLYETFMGTAGEKYLKAIVPTAVLLDVDETVLNLPWELIGAPGSSDAIANQVPFGRLVTTRLPPRRARDPQQEDAVVRILAVSNPTADLSSTDSELESLLKLAGNRGEFSVEVSMLTREKATRVSFAKMLSATDYDIVHFAGHASFDPSQPEASALHFADGLISADDVVKLPWRVPPYLVFNNACESGRAAGGKRLVSEANQSNGLAAAFLAAGVDAYAGYFWPVTDTGARLFAEVFYNSLFTRENVGLAFLDARNRAMWELAQEGDLTGCSAILFGDAASKHRRDLAMAA